MAKENIIKPTPEQLEDWKAKYKAVHILTVENFVGYLRNIDRRTLSAAMNKISRSDIVGAAEIILENCWLGGDDEIKKDDDVFGATVTVIGDLLQTKKAELENLNAPKKIKEGIEKPNAKQIEDWKKEFKTVHKITVDGKVAYFAPPKRKVLSEIMAQISKADLVQGMELFIGYCWLGGDTEIQNDDDLFVAASMKLGDLIQTKTAELEKL